MSALRMQACSLALIMDGWFTEERMAQFEKEEAARRELAAKVTGMRKNL